MRKFTIPVQINAPVSQVFAMHTSVERIPEWFPGAQSVSDVTAPMDQPGARYTIHFSKQPSAYEEVLDVTPNRYHRRRFTMQNPLMHIWGVATAEFETVAGGTAFELTLEYGFDPAWLSPLLETLMDTSIKGAVQREVNSFKAFVEKEAEKMAAA